MRLRRSRRGRVLGAAYQTGTSAQTRCDGSLTRTAATSHKVTSRSRPPLPPPGRCGLPPTRRPPWSRQPAGAAPRCMRRPPGGALSGACTHHCTILHTTTLSIFESPASPVCESECVRPGALVVSLLGWEWQIFCNRHGVATMPEAVACILFFEVYLLLETRVRSLNRWTGENPMLVRCKTHTTQG